METDDAASRKTRGVFRKIAIWILLLVAAYLIGYLPTRIQIAGLRENEAQLKHLLQLAILRGRLGMMSYEANRNNYANAAQYSTEYFDGLRAAIDQTGDLALRQRFQLILAQRDQLTAAITQANPAVKDQLAQLYAEFYNLTTNGIQATQ